MAQSKADPKLPVVEAVQNTVPLTISHQGYLTDGGAAANGTVDLNFGLFTVAAGGSPVWVESHSSVPVTDGVYSVNLGSVSAFTSAVDFNVPLWLQTAVGATVLSPRTALSAAPYALGLKLPFKGAHNGSGGAIQLSGTFGSGYGTSTSGFGGGHFVSSTGIGVEMDDVGTGVDMNARGPGIRIGDAATEDPGDGVWVGNVGSPTSSQSSSTNNGFEVEGSEGSGLYVGHADQYGVRVQSATQNGVRVETSGGSRIPCSERHDRGSARSDERCRRCLRGLRREPDTDRNKPPDKRCRDHGCRG